ncbi:hypothetical protein ABZP36_035184 [Zizania latifolia]
MRPTAAAAAAAAFVSRAVADSNRAVPLAARWRARRFAVRSVASTPASKPAASPSKVWASTRNPQGSSYWLDDVQCSGSQREVHPVPIQIPCLRQP